MLFEISEVHSWLKSITKREEKIKAIPWHKASHNFNQES